MKSFRFAEFGPLLVVQIDEVAFQNMAKEKHLISHFTEAGRQEV